MRLRAVVCVLLAVVALTAVGPPAALGQSGAGVGEATNSTEAATTIAIQPQPDGNARFQVVTAFTLHGRNDTAAFRALGREFEEGSVGVSIATFERAAVAATNATGRPMNVTNVTRNATIVERTASNDTGRLVVGFTWTNFARQSGDRLLVGDAFNTTRGTWLPRLTDGQTLLIETPGGYTIDTSPIGYTNRTLRWNGPASFEPGDPRVIYERSGRPAGPPLPETPETGAGTATETTSDDGDGSDPGPLASVPPLVFGAGAVVLGAGVVIVGVYTWTRGGPDDDSAPRTPEAADADTDAESTPASERSRSAAEPEAAGSESSGVELLSDEERVERLLERNDGRMKQASIVDETGWSNAKVSQLLSSMDDAGRIEKLRIGRENLISLPDGDDDRV